MTEYTGTASGKPHIDFERIKHEAQGRWADILPALTALSAEVLHKGSDDHPCPLCNGSSVIWPADDAQQTGRIACRTCTSNKPTGDGIATVAIWAGMTQGEAAKAIAGYLGIDGHSHNKPQRDLIEEVCREKRMPVDGFKQFGPIVTKQGRGKNDVVRVPVYNERGEAHSHFDFAGTKGIFARGKGMAGMFLPGRSPQPGETWHIVEGCKDAAALVGLGYLAAGLPTSVMADKYARLFEGVHVVIVPDLDDAGQSGAQLTGGRLSGIAASVKVARLPGENVAKGGDDVRDVLKRPDGEKLVRGAIDNAATWTPREGEIDAQDGRPEVLITLAYGWCVDQVCCHLGRVGWDSPWIPKDKRERLKIYQRGGSLVHVVAETTPEVIAGKIELPAGTPRIRPLPQGQLPLRVADACQLIKEVEVEGDIERKAVPPERWLIEGLATRGEYGRDVRRLEGIITAPTLRPDGTILQTPGYDERTGLLYQPSDKFPKVPEKPSIDDARAAAAMLLEVFSDFDVVDDADRSAWLALPLTYIGRPAIVGCTPLFAVTSWTRGSGKSISVDAASLIAFGRPAARKPYARDDDEMRKAITSIAMEALPAVLIDNVDRVLGGASLDAALTGTTWQDRVLGKSATTGEIPLTTVWAATGNNLSYGTDLARRVVPIRLAPKIENPEERTDFAHPDLLGWVRENRPRLAVAALTMLRAYFIAGKPPQPGGQFGSFESWSALVRGAIVWTGLPDPLKTRETAKADDTSGAIVRGLIGGLLEVDDSGEGITAREIIALLNEQSNERHFPAMREAVAEAGTYKGKIDSKALGLSLRKYRGRIANGYQINGSPNRSGVIKWTTKRVESAGDAGYAGDHSGDPYAGSECVTTPNDIGDTHINRVGNGPKVSPASPASPAPSAGSEVEI